MKPGEAFEIDCHNYLIQNYSKPNIIFRHNGGMDSTTSDICVIKNGCESFYIEAKDASAQSGQFVLLPDKEKRVFVFSKRNRSVPNDMTNVIINYMNLNFDRFNNAGTSGEHLDIDRNVFSNWIIGHYMARNVKYVISYYNGFIIFPIRKFADYFDISANYRIKKSGSGEPSQRDTPAVKNLISSVYPNAEFVSDGKKLFVSLNDNLSQNKFYLNDRTYLLSPRDYDYYEIKKLSNTYNMNVIFSIKSKRPQDPNDLLEFQNDL